MKAPTLDEIQVKKLRDYLTARRFAIPKLQRNFVWDANRAAKLLDSMFREMPIGSLFLWEMDRKSANLIRQSADVLPTFNPSEPRIWFVIDGQQRLSVIHQAFAGENRKNDAGREIDFGRLCFVVSPDRGQDNPPRIVYRKPVDASLIPLRDILAPDWKKHMPNKNKALRRKVQDCRDRLLSYPVPVVTVKGATLEEIGEVFIRLNAQGMKITSADRAIALMGKIDVRAMAAELRQSIRDDGFALTGLDAILMGFNLVAERPKQGDPPKLEAMARRWSKRIDGDPAEVEHFRKLWAKFKTAFLSAVALLRNRYPVADDSYLPSANMLATLSVFFFHHSGPPSGSQAAEIRKWFWATGVAQRYSGRGYHRNIVSDARFFEALGKGTRKRFVLEERLDPADIQASIYTSRAARTRAFFCLLAKRRPRYLEGGEEIPLGEKLSHADRKNRHHIFPKAQLRRHFPARVYNSLCNICFLVSRENQKIGMALPRRYLQKFKQDAPGRFARNMRSHLIPASTESGIWSLSLVKSFKEFRQERLRVICAELEREAGIKLFRKM